MECIREVALHRKYDAQISYLTMPDSRVSDEGAQALADALSGNSTLESLFLHSCVERSSSSQTIRLIHTGFGEVRGGGVMALAKLLATSNSLQRLVLKGISLQIFVLTFLGTQIEDNGATAFAKSLKVNTSLRHLEFGGASVLD